MRWYWKGHHDPNPSDPAIDPGELTSPDTFSSGPAGGATPCQRQSRPRHGPRASAQDEGKLRDSVPESRQPGGYIVPVLAFAKEVEAEFTSRVRRVPRLFRALLRKIGLRLEARDPLQHFDRTRVINTLFPEGVPSRSFWVRFLSLMALSVTIAGLGVLSDSTAVVIGAMLVAPLMGPVLGVAAAVVMAWPQRLVRQLALVAAGAVLGIGLAALISWIVPGDVDPLPGELLARTSPNLLDLGIAVAAGAAGAYARARRQASDALPGVAVAVALVPPLAVTGIALQMGEWQMANGAFLLFCVNVVGIVLSAALTFIVSGLVPGRRLLTGSSTIASGLRWTIVAVIMVVLPLQYGRGRLLPPTDRTTQVIAAIHDFVEADKSQAGVVDISIGTQAGVTDVAVVVAGAAPGPPVTALARLLAETLDSPVTLKLKVVEATTASASVTAP